MAVVHLVEKQACRKARRVHEGSAEMHHLNRHAEPTRGIWSVSRMHPAAVHFAEGSIHLYLLAASGKLGQRLGIDTSAIHPC